MTWINAVLRAVFDTVLGPVAGLPAMVGLSLAALACSIGMLWIFKRTSNQDALAEIKNQIHAGLFEIRLFNDDLPAIFRAQAGILKANAKYLWHSLPPMLWIIVPIFFVVAQMQFHYGYEGLEPGDSALLTVRFQEEAELAKSEEKPAVTLDVPDGLAVETDAVWAPVLRELTWRIGAEKPGDYLAMIGLDGAKIDKTVRVNDRLVRLSPTKVAKGILDQLIFPAEDPVVGADSIESIDVSYADREISFFGWHTHWLVAFFAMTIVFAFLLRKPMGVTI